MRRLCIYKIRLLRKKFITLRNRLNNCIWLPQNGFQQASKFVFTVFCVAWYPSAVKQAIFTLRLAKQFKARSRFESQYREWGSRTQKKNQDQKRKFDTKLFDKLLLSSCWRSPSSVFTLKNWQDEDRVHGYPLLQSRIETQTIGR